MSNFNKTTTSESTAYAGSGAFYVAAVDDFGTLTGEHVPLGLVTSANLTIETTEIEALDSSGGLNELFASVTTQRTATMTFTLSELSFAKIAQHLFGSYSVIAEESVVSEPHTVIALNSYIFFKKIIKDQAAVVVTDDTDTITYVAGVDYDVETTGIKILEGGSISVDDVIHVSYTAEEHEKIEGFTKTSNKKNVIFQGISISDDKFWEFEGFKLSFKPMSALPFIAVDEFGTYELTATLEKVSDTGSNSDFFDLIKQK